MTILKTNPKNLPGPWVDGRVLDNHTVSSAWTGDPFHYDTKRTELGERVYRLKYGGAIDVIGDIIDTPQNFIAEWKPKVDLIVPAPPSRNPSPQPVPQNPKGTPTR